MRVLSRYRACARRAFKESAKPYVSPHQFSRTRMPVSATVKVSFEHGEHLRGFGKATCLTSPVLYNPSVICTSGSRENSTPTTENLSPCRQDIRKKKRKHIETAITYLGIL